MDLYPGRGSRTVWYETGKDVVLRFYVSPILYRRREEGKAVHDIETLTWVADGV